MKIASAALDLITQRQFSEEHEGQMLGIIDFLPLRRYSFQFLTTL